MIIDCHGHYTTAPPALEAWRKQQIAAIREGREPNSSVAKVLPCYEVLDQLERQLA